jgi:S-formylglutathione hydrolase FrmB
MKMIPRTSRESSPQSRWIGIISILLLLCCFNCYSAPDIKFEVTIKPGLISTPQTGRLLVILSRKNSREPRLSVTSTEVDAPIVLGCDANAFVAFQSIVVDRNAIISPITNLSELSAGNYFIQALLVVNTDLLSPDAPGNLYSSVVKAHLSPALTNTIQLELNQQIGPEQLPAETDLVKFVKMKSDLLSKFHGRPIYLRAGVILPRDYEKHPSRKYPLWIRIGGFGSSYTSVLSLMSQKSDFRKTWTAKDTPKMILLQLDGAGPYGDCYQVNSDNNGPYGDAIIRELIPCIEQRFRAIPNSKARVLSGHSTGGWSSLALQIFYPDFFNGVWSSSPDGVDFRAFELVDIYTDKNAYVNKFGFERPSERTVQGETKLTMRREVQIENVLARGNNWALSGGQWGAWNATYGPKGPDGLPISLWDPQTGIINRDAAEHWKSYDLRLVLQKNWKTLAPKLQDKIHISVGDADNYFLNNAVHLMDEFLSKAAPPFKGRIVYGSGKGHGWYDLTLIQMMTEMKEATDQAGN